MTKKNSKIDTDEFISFVQEFDSETDQAAVILGAAKLDTLLYQLISKLLLPSTTSIDELLEGESPLGTFSSRINITYRLGLIDAAFAKALHLIRKIRNAFAHELSGCTLDSGAQRDRVKELVLPFRDIPIIKQFEEIFFEKPKHSGPSAEFRIILSVMIVGLEHAILRVKPISNDKVFKLILDHWKEWKEPESSTTKLITEKAEKT